MIGKIVIGDDVMIAPNSFVNFDVPSHSLVIGTFLLLSEGRTLQEIILITDGMENNNNFRIKR